MLNHGRTLVERLREAAARRQPFEVVLLDHSLPDATTTELLRAIRLEPSLAGTWVVLMSAFDFDPSYEGARAIKPDMCIAKPVRQKLLIGALRAAREPREPEVAEARPAPEAREAPPTPAGVLSLGLDVLVVDDNAINREVAQAMLERAGCNVTVAEEGGAALEHVGRRRFDAILMDCQMPGTDGYAATAAIRRMEAERRSPAMPIVALTANVLARDRSRCLEAGMNHFLSKPFTQDQLIAVLRPISAERGKLVLPAAAPVPKSRAPGSTSAATVAQPARSAEAAQVGRPAAGTPQTVAAEVVEAPVEEEEMLLSDTAVFNMLDSPLRSEAAPVEAAPAAASPAAVAPDAASLAAAAPVEDAPVPVPVLDQEQVQAIRGLGRPQVFERLCQLLFTTAPDSIKRLRAALESGDLDAIAGTAHALKSPVSSLGGRRLAAQLDRCERAAREARDVEAARRAARGLEQCYAELGSALRGECARATGS